MVISSADSLVSVVLGKPNYEESESHNLYDLSEK